MSLRLQLAFLNFTIFGWLTRTRQTLMALGLFVGVMAWLGTGYAYVPLPTTEQRIGAAVQGDGPTAGDTRERLLAENRRLRAKLDRLMPRGVYIVVDQSQNRLYLKQRDRVFLTAVCSSGSGMVLLDEGTKRRWVFDTPRGRFTVSSKLTNPSVAQTRLGFCRGWPPGASGPGRTVGVREPWRTRAVPGRWVHDSWHAL